MWRLVLTVICLAGDFRPFVAVGAKDAPILGAKDSARILRIDIISGGFKHKVYQNHSVFLYDDDSGEMYLGGTDFVLRIDVDNTHNQVTETFQLYTTAEQEPCQEGPCENVVTVIEKFQDSLFVCGTNGHKPKCWKLSSSANNQSNKIEDTSDGTGISPYTYTQKSLSLAIEGDLYAAAPLYTDGSLLHFRRKAGNRTRLSMYDNWVSEPTFISASWVKRNDDADNEKIYVFFREKNSDHNREADPWISRVARVCKVDEGGSKRFFQNLWTSFLKARLVCGFPEESLYFNRLQDIYVVHADDWHNTRVYALFTSSWNSTAVCIYSVKKIEEIFENSTFKGYDKEIPNPRPGTCVKDSRNLPLLTVNIVKDYPEMSDWVHSEHYKAPFYVSNNNYTKIAVDRVQAADQHVYNVLLLATDSGKIHKVLEADSGPFIISETQLSSRSTIQSMKLDTRKKKLVVGFAEKVAIVDLQACEGYNKSCADCVMAQDPYCAWTDSGCTPTVPGGIQNIITGKKSVCPTSFGEHNQGNRAKREITPTSTVYLETLHSVTLGVPFYLSCPIDSYHAVYTWNHSSQSSPCLQMQSNCLLLIPAMTEENYGRYECISKEKDHTKAVKIYHLEHPIIPDSKPNHVRNPLRENIASLVVPQIVWVILGLSVAMLDVFR